MKANQKIKYLILGMIIMTVFSAVAPSMAAMVQKKITVSTGVLELKVEIINDSIWGTYLVDTGLYQ